MTSRKVKKDKPKRQCPQCDKQFVAYRDHQVFCSTACKQRAYRARIEEKLRKLARLEKEGLA